MVAIAWTTVNLLMSGCASDGARTLPPQNAGAGGGVQQQSHTPSAAGCARPAWPPLATHSRGTTHQWPLQPAPIPAPSARPLPPSPHASFIVRYADMSQVWLSQLRYVSAMAYSFEGYSVAEFTVGRRGVQGGARVRAVTGREGSAVGALEAWGTRVDCGCAGCHLLPAPAAHHHFTPPAHLAPRAPALARVVPTPPPPPPAGCVVQLRRRAGARGGWLPAGAAAQHDRSGVALCARRAARPRRRLHRGHGCGGVTAAAGADSCPSFLGAPAVTRPMTHSSQHAPCLSLPLSRQ